MATGDDRRPVSGLAWLDHAWGDVPLPLGPIAFDRLSSSSTTASTLR